MKIHIIEFCICFIVLQIANSIFLTFGGDYTCIIGSHFSEGEISYKMKKEEEVDPTIHYAALR